MAFARLARFSSWSLVCALSLVASSASAQATLITGLGGPADFGPSPNCLGPNDDGSSASIDLTGVFPAGLRFFDRTHTSMFVNTNGNITFSNGLPLYSPSAFPIANQPMIAPYWADVDIRPPSSGLTICGGFPDGTGRPDYVYAGDCMDPADQGIWWYLDETNHQVIVTWDHVGFYRCHTSPTDPAMSFQLVLTAVDGGCGAPGTDFDVEFRFAECGWNTGDASGGTGGLSNGTVNCVRRVGGGRDLYCPIDGTICTGTTCPAVPAQSGFDAGNLVDFVEIMGSRTNEIHTILCTMSNVGDPGVWRFSVREGGVFCDGAGAACTVPGTAGVCAEGRTNCVAGSTTLECVQQIFPVPEVCDGIDNDCTGVADDAADVDMCGLGFRCVAGACVTNCFESACDTGFECNTDGLCVELGCAGVTCDPGLRCSAGSCVAACDGVTCPFGQECRDGRCVDRCAGIDCGGCQACDVALGTCIDRCSTLTACPAGASCDIASGLCVETACAGVTCAAGERCMGGTCVDLCIGVTCPFGQECRLGACVSTIMPDAGVAFDAGVIVLPDAGNFDAGPGFDGGVPGVDAGPAPTPPGMRGCACRASGAGGAPAGLLAGLGLALALVLRRRTRD